MIQSIYELIKISSLVPGSLKVRLQVNVPQIQFSLVSFSNISKYSLILSTEMEWKEWDYKRLALKRVTKPLALNRVKSCPYSRLVHSLSFIEEIKKNSGNLQYLRVWVLCHNMITVHYLSTKLLWDI